MINFSKVALEKIAKKYDLADVYLFGSRISGFSRKDSDLDIAVRFNDGLPGVEKRAKLYGDIFSDLSVCFAEMEVDLVFIDEVPLHLQFKVINSGQLIYANNTEDAMNFQEKTANYYNDYRYFIDEYFKGILEAPIHAK